MVKIITNEKTITVKNYDDALRKCTQLYFQGIPINRMKIMSNREQELPVTTTHLTRFHKK